MTTEIASILHIAGQFDAIVFDQWGVLHNGSTPYPFAVEAIERLAKAGIPLGVLSNSGKRADLNAVRITGMGFPEVFAHVMTSGEALWQDVATGVLPYRRMLPITGAPGDAEYWRGDLALEFTETLNDADAILLMGLPDQDDHSDTTAILDRARENGMPLICSNPDRASPREGGTVISPGALAHAYADAGGDVTFYGKPHRAVFTALERALGTRKILMVGDSPEHDIAGAQGARWASLFIAGGLHADHSVAQIFAGHPLPDFILPTLR